jgi:hypothetical protein
MLAESLRRGEDLDVFEAKYWRLLGKKYANFHAVNRVIRSSWPTFWLAVKAYYSNNLLGRLIKQLLRL